MCKSRPLAFAVACGCIKDSTCDMVMQAGERSAARSNGVELRHDWRRTGVFALFGATFVGAWQYALFSKALPLVSPVPAGFAAMGLAEKMRHRAGLKSVAALVFVENFINQPFFHFPTLYAIKDGMERQGDFSITKSLSRGVEEAYEKVVPDNVASLALWVPATVVNGMFMPVWARVPFITLCGCAWTSWLSLNKGAAVEAAETSEPNAMARAESPPATTKPVKLQKFKSFEFMAYSPVDTHTLPITNNERRFSVGRGDHNLHRSVGVISGTQAGNMRNPE